MSCCIKGAKVYGSVYKFDREEFASSLVERAGNESELKLNFQLACGFADMDSSAASSINRILKGLMGSAKVYTVDPEGMMNHNKFMLFQAIDLGKLKRKQPKWAVGDGPFNWTPALYLSSANLTYSSNGKHNNSVLVPIDAAIYNALEWYSGELEQEYESSSQGDNTSKENRYLKIKSDRCKVYLFPRREGSHPSEFTDMLVGVLKNLPHAHSKSSRACEIRIAVPAWYDTREELARTVAECSKNGAWVRIKTRKPGSSSVGTDLGEKIEKILRKAKGDLEYRYQDSGESIHSKYVLIDGPYRDGDAHREQKLVWTGSPNFSGHAVYNHWEMICKLYQETGAYEVFKNDFEALPA